MGACVEGRVGCGLRVYQLNISTNVITAAWVTFNNAILVLHLLSWVISYAVAASEISSNSIARNEDLGFRYTICMHEHPPIGHPGQSKINRSITCTSGIGHQFPSTEPTAYNLLANPPTSFVNSTCIGSAINSSPFIFAPISLKCSLDPCACSAAWSLYLHKNNQYHSQDNQRFPSLFFFVIQVSLKKGKRSL